MVTHQQSEDPQALEVKVIILFNKLLRYKITQTIQQTSCPGFGKKLQTRINAVSSVQGAVRYKSLADRLSLCAQVCAVAETYRGPF